MGKLYRNYSTAWSEIKPIEVYFTTIHINLGEKVMEKTYAPPEKLAKKTSSYRACGLDMSRTEPSGFKGG